MICVHCGTENHNGRRYCTSCLRDVALPDDVSVDTAPWINLDDIQPPTSKLALASLALGLLAVFPPAGVGAVALGHASLLSIRQNEGRVRGGDVAKLGLICGYIGLALFGAVMFVATRYLNVPLKSFIIPPPVQAATLPDQASTPTPKPLNNAPTVDEIHGMNALLQLSVAQTVHYHTYPQVGYACSLGMLKATGLPDDAMTTAAEHGYLLLIESCTKSPTGKVTGYHGIVTPRPGVSGRSFCTDNTSIIRTPVDSDLANCPTSGIPVK